MMRRQCTPVQQGQSLTIFCMGRSRLNSAKRVRGYREKFDTCRAHTAYREPGGSSQVYLGTGERVQELSRILLCSSKGLRTMARRYPPLLLMEPEDLLHRMLALKAELPDCDIASMLYSQPFLFLRQSSSKIVQQVSGNYKIFVAELPELVDSVVQERPAVLFIDQEYLQEGLPHLRSVSKHAPYPTDSTGCANLLWSFFGRSLEDKYDRIF